VIGDRTAAFKDLPRPARRSDRSVQQCVDHGLTGNLRYYIDRSTQTFSYEVLDRQNPGKAIFSAARNSYRP